MYRIGIGSDVHRLVVGRPLMIGGVRIDAEFGGDGHSDADVLLHAITDALLGALALGDIGTHFPNSASQWKDAESAIFLRDAVTTMTSRGFRVVNVDSVVSLERPQLRSFIDEMREKIAAILETDPNVISVKAKTGEGVDSVGRSEAIRADAVVLLTSE